MLSTLIRLTTGSILVLALAGCQAPTGSVTSVTIDGGDQTIVLGDTPTLTATVEVTGTASTAVTWTSSNETVATIAADGQVTPLTTGTTDITATSTVDPSKSDAIALTVDPPGLLRWTRQIGTVGNDEARRVSTDANGNVYTTGITDRELDGTNAGSYDAYVRSFDGSGNLRWTRQFGTSNFDAANAIATDANGNVYIAGDTFGALAGANAGSVDAFIRSYDADGTLRWTRQFGTSMFDSATGIGADANGNVYIAGETDGDLEGSSAGGGDAFIRAYDADGNPRWTRQFGSSSFDRVTEIATDADGNIYAAGTTSGDLEGNNAGGNDAFIRAYDNDGNLRWTRQFGSSSNDFATGIALDNNGNAYATGYTLGDLEGSNAGGFDAFIRSFDSNGSLRWTRQFGTSGDDYAWSIAARASGDVYTTGDTNGDLEGSNVGGADAFVRAYDKDGELRWTRQFGTSDEDFANGIALDANGNAYIAGDTLGALESSSAGNLDAFIRSYGR